MIDYYFEKIENELAFKLLTNKKFIHYLNLNKIQYKFELFPVQSKHSNVLNDIIDKKITQKVLFEDEIFSIRRTLDRL
jgi:hypothetical protein